MRGNAVLVDHGMGVVTGYYQALSEHSDRTAFNVLFGGLGAGTAGLVAGWTAGPIVGGIATIIAPKRLRNVPSTTARASSPSPMPPCSRVALRGLAHDREELRASDNRRRRHSTGVQCVARAGRSRCRPQSGPAGPGRCAWR